MNNEELKKVYDDFHLKGPSSWFSQGEEERELILKMGEPWNKHSVLEIGCGEGDLAFEIAKSYCLMTAIDYSGIAIKKAKEKWQPLKQGTAMEIKFIIGDYRRLDGKVDRIVMQGVLEHLDNPFPELKWMMDNLLTEKGDVITSSPCFLNPRGIVWMTLNMLGAVMSKTDLHYLHPWEFQEFCYDNKFQLSWDTCDWSWGRDIDMISDLKVRIPLALKDGNIPYSEDRLTRFMEWLDSRMFSSNHGATAVYRIRKA